MTRQYEDVRAMPWNFFGSACLELLENETSKEGGKEEEEDEKVARIVLTHRIILFCYC